MPAWASPAIASPLNSPVASGRKKGWSTASAVSGTNRPLSRICSRNGGESPAAPAGGGESFSAIVMTTGIAPSAAASSHVRHRCAAFASSTRYIGHARRSRGPSAPSTSEKNASSSESRSGTSARTRMPAATSAAFTSAGSAPSASRTRTPPGAASAVTPGHRGDHLEGARAGRRPRGGGGWRRRGACRAGPRRPAGRAPSRRRGRRRPRPRPAGGSRRTRWCRRRPGPAGARAPRACRCGSRPFVGSSSSSSSGSPEQGERDAEPLAHPLAVRLHALVGRVGEPDAREDVVDAAEPCVACRRRTRRRAPCTRGCAGPLRNRQNAGSSTSAPTPLERRRRASAHTARPAPRPRRRSG